MTWYNWLIVIVPFLFVIGMAFYARRYIRDVVDYLAAGRVCGRYVIAVAGMESALGLITPVAYSEMHYKQIPRKIVCERFLQSEDGSDVIPDYKVYCFHGEPKAILVMHDRGKKIRSEFFDTNWNALENTENYMSTEQLSPRPECLEDMLEISRKLSAKFPFVRCDYYNVNGKLYFGELTFTPACGLYTSQTTIGGKDMSCFLNIPDKLGRQ